jgi:hypothetical protein
MIILADSIVIIRNASAFIFSKPYSCEKELILFPVTTNKKIALYSAQLHINRNEHFAFYKFP